MAEKLLLSAAFLCERVLLEKDDVASIVRIIDILYVHLPPELPKGAKPVIQLTAFASFKRGGIQNDPETHHAKLRVEDPAGKMHDEPMDISFAFKPGEVASANLIFAITMGVNQFGRFVLHLSIDNEPTAQIPFMLLEQPQPKSPERTN